MPGLAAFAKASAAERASGPAQPWRRRDPGIHPYFFDGLPGQARSSPAMTAAMAASGSFPKRKHVKAKPPSDDIKQQHGLEGERYRGCSGSAMTAEARHQRDTERDIHQEGQRVGSRADILVAEHV